MAPLLFEDTFTVVEMDPDGKKFDKVSRIEANSDEFEAYTLLDVNTDIYPVYKGKRYTIALATTLDLDGTPDTGYYNPGRGASLADKYDYVMHGRLYRVSEKLFFEIVSQVMSSIGCWLIWGLISGKYIFHLVGF